MQLPDEQTKKEYMEAQRRNVFEALTNKKFELEVEKEWLKKVKDKDIIRATEDNIEQLEKVIEGQQEYVDMLNEMLGDTIEAEKEALIRLYKDKIEEAKKGNFRGYLGAELQKRRLKKATEKDLKRVAEDDIEQIERDVNKNDVLISVAEKLIKKLK